VLALSFSPDGKLLATGGGEPSRSGELKIFNVADGKLDRAIADAHSDTIFGVSFSPDGKELASCAADRFVKVFDSAKGTLLRSFEGHTHHVLGVAWRADGKVIASCGADNVVKVWDFLTGDQKLTTQPLGKEVTSIQFIGDSPRTIVTSGDKTVRLFNTDNGGNERNYPGGEDFMYSLAITVDGKIAVAGGQDSVLKVWNVENAQVIRTFEPPKPKSPEPNQSADKK
jgi:WD40 repeat protein